ncbi:hypothetical protein FACS189499_01920 [Clostridia bacterium]|nr:hypothetical protein FACS189499_01920 [Clostridia bacterium]
MPNNQPNNKRRKTDSRIAYVDFDGKPVVLPDSGGAAAVSGGRRRRKKRKQFRNMTTWEKVRTILSVIFTSLLALILVIIITLCIVAVALTVYVMQFAESSSDIDLMDAELSYSSFLVAYDETGEEVVKKQLNTDENRVWVDIEDMPQSLIDAVVSVEDKRFFDHDGVDWTRTVGVVYYAVMSGEIGAGGSTITQQLVRDVTKDNGVTVGRKLREIFRALSLEQTYTKYDILESYLNRISFGGTSYGVGSAAVNYFDKDVQDLDIAESAILAGIIRSPSNYNPYANLHNCRERQEYALGLMLDVGFISNKEYDTALAEQVRFRKPVRGEEFGYIDERYNEYYGILDVNNDGVEDETQSEDLYFENSSWEEVRDEIPYKWNSYKISQNWYDDAVINQVVNDLAEQRGISLESARKELINGGFRIYSNENMKLQEILEAKFQDPLTCLSGWKEDAKREDLLQAAFIINDYRGNVQAVVGAIGDKEGDNCFSRATQSYRSIGSTIKPIAVYAPAINMNVINYSTMTRDISGEIRNPDSNDPNDRIRWPYNYEESFPGTGNYFPTWYAVQKSTNTIAVQTLQKVGLQNAYNILTEQLGFTSLDRQNDLSWSPLAFGAFTNGERLHELAGAFQTIGNGGMYYKPYFYSKVVDNTGKVILEQDYTGTQAFEKDTAWIVNRMMKKVIEDPAGSGQHAKLPNVEVIGKTGTTNDLSNLLFVGLTPNYVGAYRIGYDDNRAIGRRGSDGWKTLALVWHDVMIDIEDTGTEKTFTPESSVVTLMYCAETGLIATDKCPSKVVGYYRKTGIPQSCNSAHDGTYWETHGSGVPFYIT